MSVGFIDSSCTQQPALGVAVGTLLRGCLSSGGPVAESGLDTSRGGYGFPPLPIVMTRICGRLSLTCERREGGSAVPPARAPRILRKHCNSLKIWDKLYRCAICSKPPPATIRLLRRGAARARPCGGVSTIKPRSKTQAQ